MNKNITLIVWICHNDNQLIVFFKLKLKLKNLILEMN